MASAELMEWDTALTALDGRQNYAEDRFITIDTSMGVFTSWCGQCGLTHTVSSAFAKPIKGSKNLMKKFNHLSNPVIDDDGNVETLPKEFFKIAKRGRPVLDDAQKKVPVSIRLDPDVLAWFRQLGNGWQSRINDTLRAEMETSE